MSKIPLDVERRVSAEFQNRLNELVEESQLSKREFAKNAGVSKDVIIRGTLFGIIPSLQSLVKIADMLNISIDYLLGVSDVEKFYRAEERSSFHNRLEQLSSESGVKYSQISHSMPFPNSYFYDWIREGTIPSLEYLRAIAEYFGVSVDYMLGRTDERD